MGRLQQNLAALLLLFVFVVRAAVTWTATPFNPAAIPLAVRTPYLSCWLSQGSGTALNGAWPSFWTGSTLGWAGYIRVDGDVYNFLGDPNVPGATALKAVQKSFQFTSTRSIFVMEAGPVDLTVEFLSPVEPNDLVLQSLPFSYLSLIASSNDGNTHSVQIYTDISAEWVSGDNSLTANWTTTMNNAVLTHQVQLSSQAIFTEIADHSQYGSAMYSTIAAIFAFASDVGLVSKTAPPVTFAIGHIRDPAIEYITDNNGRQSRSLHFFSQYPQLADAISFFLHDYANAVARANAFDARVTQDAKRISDDYESIVALSIRQAFAATEITVSKNSNGSFNTDDVLMFMKEISSDGNVNTVDVIYPSWPLFLYCNAELGRYLLEGLFLYQATGQYPNKWSVHDLGAHYPQAIGHNDESGNMLIMSLSYTQLTNDNSLISKYFALLDQWTQFLIADSLIPANQISTDDFAGSLANQTNLAIKGIVGIKAMSVISGRLGFAENESNYSSIATSYAMQWQSLATASNEQHLTLSYGNDSSWGLAYNLYADKLLRTNVFPPSVFEMQTAWYKTVVNPFGIPLDTSLSVKFIPSADWEMWTAAIATDNATRDIFVGSIRKVAADGLSGAPCSDWYETTNGQTEGFRARPVVGGNLAMLFELRQIV
ncbi:DUF1793-domain-containing protein [Rickenella mellea]|uniref:DUF1793-domain-containing protein n=1 Tax=Rickenella mellea TaxID=50990 RepID=A0A4Y7QM19_9AGAM|nr:DUF1793-domain-containing protein [Rickenella mellea]